MCETCVRVSSVIRLIVHLDLNLAPSMLCVYGVAYIDLVSLVSLAAQVDALQKQVDGAAASAAADAQSMLERITALEARVTGKAA